MQDLNEPVDLNELREVIRDVLGFGAENGSHLILSEFGDEPNGLSFAVQRESPRLQERGRTQRFVLTLAADNRMTTPCTNCKSNGRDPHQAYHRLWCPTWITAHTGPLSLCDFCVRVFQPEHNPNARGGSWHWGINADKAFKSVELFVPAADYSNARRMVLSGKNLSDGKNEKGLYMLDGKVWLVGTHLISRLGTLDHVREIFPELLKETQFD